MDVARGTLYIDEPDRINSDMRIKDELVRHSSSWHEQVQPEAAIRPEDVVLSAFVAIRKIAVSLS